VLDKVLILTTGWEEDYWEKEKEAPYPGRKYTNLSEWDSLRENCPIAGLGIYTKYRKNDFRDKNFVYLRIDGMRFDETDGRPYFNFKPVKISSLSSKALLDQLPQLSGKLFLSLKSDDVLNALSAIGETSPDEWLALAKGASSLKTVSWQDCIGRYF